MKNFKHREYHNGDVIALMAGGIVVVLGILVLLGWILRFPLLTSFGTDLLPMAPSTALLLLLFGTALASRILLPESRFTYVFSIVIGSLVSAIAMMLFFSSSAGLYLNIEHPGFSNSGSLDGIPIGHMSPVTAVCFVICVLAFLLTLSPSVERAKRAWTAFILASLVTLTSSLFLIAYLFASPLMYGGRVVPPSLPASLAFLILSVGLVVRAGHQVWPDNVIKDASTARDAYVLLLIFILLAAGIVTGGYFAFRNYEHNYRTEIEHQLSAITDLKVDQLVQWRKERTGDGQIFYRNNVFSVLVKRYLQNANDHDAKARILEWVGQAQRAYGYDLMMLLDARFSTKLVFPENRELARLVIDQRNAEILLSGNMAFQDFYRNEQDHHVYLKILVPILEDHSPKRLIAVLALRIDPRQDLYPLIRKWPAFSKTSETLIVRRDGKDVLYLNDLKFLKDAALNLRIPLERKDVLGVKAVLGVEGVVEGLDYRGELVIGNVRAIPDSPWFLIARMNISEVYAPLRERMWLMIILVGALLAGAGAGVALLWRHQRNSFYREQYHSAEALRDSENRYRTLIEQASDGIFLSDSEGRYIEVNSAGCHLLGYTREEILKKTLHDLTSVTITQPLRLDELRAGKSLLSKREMIRKDGSLVPVEISAKQLSDGHFQGIVRDITERKQAEEALRESEEKFRTIFENSSSAMAIIERDTTISMVNKEYCKLGMYEEEDVVGTSWTKQIPPEDLDRLIEYNRNRLIDPKSVPDSYEFKYIRKDGTVRNALMSVAIIPTNQKIVCSITDITERKQAEEALKASEEKFRRLLEYAPLPLCYVDKDGRITFRNERFIKVFGYTSDEVPTLAEWWMTAYPKEQYRTWVVQNWNSAVRHAAETGTDIESEVYHVTCKDGNLREIIISGITINDDFLATFVDITERKRAEEALRETNEYLENLINYANAPIIVWNASFVVTRFNHAFEQLSGYAAEEVTGKSIDVLFPEEKIDFSLDFIKRAVSGERWETVEIEIQRKDGDSRIVLWNSANILDKDGTTVVATIAQGHDITARKRAEADARSLLESSERSRSDLLSILEDQKRAEEEIQTLNAGLETRVVERTSQLEAANKELEAFSYSVSHDLRAPLRAIDGFSRIVVEEYAKKLDAEGNRLLNVICANTKKMDELITDLLNLSRVSRGEMKDARVDMVKLAKATYAETASPDVQQQYEFSVEPLPEAYCDPALVRQVWTNLISNAIKFTATKDVRRIEIGSRTEDGMNIYFIKDSGVGFDPKYTSKLFGVFQRLHKSEDFEGTGIGLAIVQRIIHRHGGEVWAEGKVGEGATFYFSLPSGRE